MPGRIRQETAIRSLSTSSGIKKAREALINRGAPQVDWPHVFYRLSPFETETLLRGSSVSDGLKRDSFGIEKDVLKY